MGPRNGPTSSSIVLSAVSRTPARVTRGPPIAPEDSVADWTKVNAEAAEARISDKSTGPLRNRVFGSTSSNHARTPTSRSDTPAAAFVKDASSAGQRARSQGPGCDTVAIYAHMRTSVTFFTLISIPHTNSTATARITLPGQGPPLPKTYVCSDGSKKRGPARPAFAAENSPPEKPTALPSRIFSAGFSSSTACCAPLSSNCAAASGFE
mmetsp:Transcript_5278/g.14582  ORF Transcript_5278/g.14582 Transcript_5278/m.14582 type:complete len:209 (+) Transcript_5278:310-936(+)